MKASATVLLGSAMLIFAVGIVILFFGLVFRRAPETSLLLGVACLIAALLLWAASDIIKLLTVIADRAKREATRAPETVPAPVRSATIRPLDS